MEGHGSEGVVEGDVVGLEPDRFLERVEGLDAEIQVDADHPEEEVDAARCRARGRARGPGSRGRPGGLSPRGPRGRGRRGSGRTSGVPAAASSRTRRAQVELLPTLVQAAELLQALRRGRGLRAQGFQQGTARSSRPCAARRGRRGRRSASVRSRRASRRSAARSVSARSPSARMVPAADGEHVRPGLVGRGQAIELLQRAAEFARGLQQDRALVVGFGVVGLVREHGRRTWPGPSARRLAILGRVLLVEAAEVEVGVRVPGPARDRLAEARLRRSVVLSSASTTPRKLRTAGLAG